MLNSSSVAEYGVSGFFGTLGVIQLATEDLSGMGMLAIAAWSAWNTHDARKKKIDNDKLALEIEDRAKKRDDALMARIMLIGRGFACEHNECPVIQVAEGKIQPLDRIRIPADFPLDRKGHAKPDDDTVDMP